MPNLTIVLSDAQLARFNAAYRAKHGADPSLDQVTAYVTALMVSFVTDSERQTQQAAVSVSAW